MSCRNGYQTSECLWYLPMSYDDLDRIKDNPELKDMFDDGMKNNIAYERFCK